MKKILIVDDDILFLRVCEVLFTKAGYNVLTLRSGKDVLMTVQKELPDLIILDLIMPGQDGFLTLNNLKQNYKTSSIPVAVLTNLDTETDMTRVMNSGAIKYFVKSKMTFREILQQLKPLLI